MVTALKSENNVDMGRDNAGLLGTSTDLLAKFFKCRLSRMIIKTLWVKEREREIEKKH